MTDEELLKKLMRRKAVEKYGSEQAYSEEMRRRAKLGAGKNAKIPESTVEKIKNSTESLSVLAAKYNVHPTTISRIKNGHRRAG